MEEEEEEEEARNFLRSQCQRFDQVFLILGNHEFFGVSREEGLRLAQSLEAEPSLNGKLAVLNRRRIDLVIAAKDGVGGGGVTILGCTLHSYVPPSQRDVLSMKVSDLHQIKDWTVDLHNEKHARDVDWLRSQMGRVLAAEGFGKKKAKERRMAPILVVKYHAPSMEGTSAAGAPQCWVFGHTHYTTDFVKRGVRLVSNQRGYVLGTGKGTQMIQRRSSSVVDRLLAGFGNRARAASGTPGVEKNRFDVQKVISV
ncbi:MAG: hypothetical protein M1816_007930 [Peltula sp. TS41687]|nr:MAG: hypothetical protein M1816_007930 [Peltula sp. TS41687]